MAGTYMFVSTGDSTIAYFDAIEVAAAALADSLTDQLDTGNLSPELIQDIRDTIHDLNLFIEEVQEEKQQFPENKLED